MLELFAVLLELGINAAATLGLYAIAGFTFFIIGIMLWEVFSNVLIFILIAIIVSILTVLIVNTYKDIETKLSNKRYNTYTQNAKSLLNPTFNSEFYDERKIEIINNGYNDKLKLQLIQSLSNDNAKIKCLPTVYDDTFRKKIILSFSDNNNKLKCLHYIKWSEYKAQIIKSIQHDANTLSLLKTILTSYSENLKIELLQILSRSPELSKCTYTESEKINLVKSFIENSNPPDNLTKVLKCILECFDNKISALQYIPDSLIKINIIINFADDTEKIQALQHVSNELAKACIISNLASNNSKRKNSNQIADNKLRDFIMN